MANTKFQIIGSVGVLNPYPVDDRYGPFSSISEALLYNVPARRFPGLTVGVTIGGVTQDYAWQNDLTDAGLILKVDVPAILAEATQYAAANVIGTATPSSSPTGTETNGQSYRVSNTTGAILVFTNFLDSGSVAIQMAADERSGYITKNADGWAYVDNTAQADFSGTVASVMGLANAFSFSGSGVSWTAIATAGAFSAMLPNGVIVSNKAFNIALPTTIGNLIIDVSGNVTLGDPDRTHFILSRFYTPNGSFYVNGVYNVNGLALGVITPLQMLKSIVTSPSFFRFYKKTDGTWNVASVATGMNFTYWDGTKKGNIAFDLPLLVSGYSNVVTDANGNVSVISDTDSTVGLFLIARCSASSAIYYCPCPYSVNGNPYNISISYLRAMTTKPESFTFYQSGSMWKVKSTAGSINFSFPDGSHVGNTDFDIPLLSSGYSNIVTDKSGNVVVIADGVALVDQFVIARVLASANLFYVNGPYSVNGNPYNLTSSTASFDISKDTPLVTNTIAFKDDQSTPIYKNGLFKTMAGDKKVNVVLETMIGPVYKRYAIENPTYLKAIDLGTSTRFVIEDNVTGKIIYKDIINVIKSVSTGHVSTLKWMSLGDSLQQGNLSVLVSPLALMMDRLSGYGITVTPVGTFDMNDGRSGGIPGVYYGEGRGFWSYKSFVGKVSQVYGTPITINTGTGTTSKFSNPFLRLANSIDKSNNPDWCFTNQTANPSDPDGVSYSTNPAYTNYYIFDFAYYLTQHGVTTPDLITIALGINDWQESGIINGADELLSLQILYKQIRAALPSVSVMIVPNNGVLPSDETQWEQEMQPLLERIVSYLEAQQLTDSKLSICPIFQHVDRWNAYGAITSVPLSANNNMQVGSISNVHVLDKLTSQIEYIDAFEAVLLKAIL